MAEANAVDELMKASSAWMNQLGFSENRIEVALQRGGLRRLMEKVCDDRLSDHERAYAYMAAEKGIAVIALIPEPGIEKVIQQWRLEAAHDTPS